MAHPSATGSRGLSGALAHAALPHLSVHGARLPCRRAETAGVITTAASRRPRRASSVGAAPANTGPLRAAGPPGTIKPEPPASTPPPRAARAAPVRARARPTILDLTGDGLPDIKAPPDETSSDSDEEVRYGIDLADDHLGNALRAALTEATPPPTPSGWTHRGPGGGEPHQSPSLSVGAPPPGTTHEVDEQGT